MLTPAQVAQELRRIASTLDSSKKPHRDLVAADIRKVIDGLKGSEPETQTKK